MKKVHWDQALSKNRVLINCLTFAPFYCSNELISPSSKQLILLHAKASSSGSLPFLFLVQACSGCCLRNRCENNIGHLVSSRDACNTRNAFVLLCFQ